MEIFLLLVGTAATVFVAVIAYRQYRERKTKADPGNHQSPAENRPKDEPDFKISIARLPKTGKDLFGREQELERLNQAWEDQGTHVISLVAWGGVGKSALVNRWLADMATRGYGGAARVFGWSFWSQGMRETEASADLFIKEALGWFGDPDPTDGSPWDKGERLAALVKAQKTLLILDGMEPLQHPPGPGEGEIKDPALKALVCELAASNPGLCVVSTRIKATDIEHWQDSTAPAVELENLSDAAGAQLLASLEVEGTEEELQEASRAFGGHGLALNLLGTYLRDVCGGDVRRMGEVRLLDEGEEQGEHARHVMAAYVNWLGEGPELAVLRLIGLFDRPAGGDLVEALKKAPAIAGLNDTLVDIGGKDWSRALTRLRRARLLLDENEPGALDAHPLVREYFGDRLRQEAPEAWRAGHERLYEHLTETAEDLPDTVEAMAPLFQAVLHGCAAGRHQEAFDQVYRRRIQRGNEFFSTHVLGAIGSELVALRGFFAEPWTKPAAALSDVNKGFVLNEVGFDLKALGRLREAAQPMEAGLVAATARENWKNGGIGASNLSELYLSMGAVEQAVDLGRRAVELAKKSGDGFLRLLIRAKLADALHQAGNLVEAEALFREAEAMQKERQPKLPVLYSHQGFLYCDLLLVRGQHGKARERAAQTIEIAIRDNQLLDIALGTLALGHVHMAEAVEAGDFSDAEKLLGDAVEALRQAGHQEFMLRGLLARAELRRRQGKLGSARLGLDEALRIAERGGMRLHMADARLEHARLCLAEKREPEARDHLAAAKEIIAETGYHRRDTDVAELESRL